MNTIRSHPEAFAIGYLLLSAVCGVLAARVIAWGEREVPTVYDREDDPNIDGDLTNEAFGI